MTAEKAANAKGDPLYRALRRYLINQCKTAPETLDEFGINLSNRQVPTPSTVVTAIALRAATRGARHTMGPRKKAKIKGQLPQTSTPSASKPA